MTLRFCRDFVLISLFGDCASPMRRRAIIASAGFLAVVIATVAFLPSRQLASQYLAPQFTCACHHTMVLEFVDGRVRLYNLGHENFYDFGSFETNGIHLIWHLPDYGTDLTMKPERFGLRVSEEQSSRSLWFRRSFSLIDTSRDAQSKKKIKEYVKDLSWVFEKIPITEPDGPANGSRFAQRQIERHRRLAPVADLIVRRYMRVS